MPRLSFALALLASLFASVAAGQTVSSHNLFVTQNGTEPTLLEPAKVLERELNAGNKHAFQVVLTKGQYARVVVEQRGINVVVRASAPDGKVIAAVDAELGHEGYERAELVADSDGSYLFKVEAATGPIAGRYAIQIEELRTATEKDLLSQEARKLDLEANRLYEADKGQEALAVAERSLTAHERAFGPDGLETATALHTLGLVLYDYQLDFPRAETFHQRALGIREKVLGGNHLRVASSLIRLADLYSSKGDYATAIPLLQRALAIKERTLGTDDPSTTYSLRSLAVLHDRKGDGETARLLFERVLANREKTLGPDHDDVGLALREISTIYSEKGDYERAETLQRRALAIFEKSKNMGLMVAALNSLGVIYGRKGDDATSEQFFQRALKTEVDASGADSVSAGFYNLNLGSFYRQTKNYGKAEEHLQRALEIWEKRLGPEHRNLPLVLTNLAALNVETGNLDKAQSQLQRALQIRQKALGENHRDVISILNRLAWVYALKGETKQAITFGSRANEIRAHDIDENLADTSERQKLAFLGSIPDQLNQSLTLHIRFAPNEPAASQAAITSILQRKGLVQEKMADTLRAMRSRLGPADRSLVDEWNTATSRLARFVLAGPRRLAPADYEQQVKAMESEREKLESEISRRSGGAFQRSQTVTLAAVRRLVPDRAALVEFTIYRPYEPRAGNGRNAYGEPRYAAYVVRGTGDVGWRDLGLAKEIDDTIESFRSALADPKRTDAKEIGRRLDAEVMQPLRPLLGDVAQLLVSPDGELNLIPFEALIDEQDRYLVEQYAFTYLTSGRDLLRMHVDRAGAGRPVVVANPSFGEASTQQISRVSVTSKQPAGFRRRSVTAAHDLSEVYFAPLSGTVREAEMIKSIFAESELFLGTSATESALKRVAKPRILHIATHGFFLEDPVAMTTLNERATTRSATGQTANPLLRSGLALAGANLRGDAAGDDGILTALEASGLNLWGTKLVVLSACNTGVGEVRNGEGVYGLRRAFMLAGAESLVMSLWPASDYATRNLMINYYKNLKLGFGRGQALRQVQLDLLKRNKKLHPFYWANFIQSGDWANLNGSR
jgi:CHAT domain-containing protein/tetratricopeptide (TPR) repeat protein